MTKKLTHLEIPKPIRDYLTPYADIFERVVLTKAQRISLGKMSRAEVNELRKEINSYQAQSGIRQHYFMVYYGLMLCCLYCERECLEIRDPKQKTKKLNLVGKARSLICLAYGTCQ